MSTPFYLALPEGDISVAERGADDPDADLVRLGRIDDDLLDGERLAGGSAHRRCMLSSIVRNYLQHPWRRERAAIPLQRMGLGLWSSMATS